MTYVCFASTNVHLDYTRKNIILKSEPLKSGRKASILAYLINRPSRILITMEVTPFYLERVKSVSFLIYITHFCSFGFLKRPNLPADLAFTITSDFRAYAAFSFFFPFRVPSNERCRNAIATADSGWGERGKGGEEAEVGFHFENAAQDGSPRDVRRATAPASSR